MAEVYPAGAQIILSALELEQLDTYNDDQAARDDDWQEISPVKLAQWAIAGQVKACLGGEYKPRLSPVMDERFGDIPEGVRAICNTRCDKAMQDGCPLRALAGLISKEVATLVA